MTSALSSIRISGLTSIDDLRLDLATPVTVLIGPNGAGKSNLVGAFELLGRIIDGQLQSTTVLRGGFETFLHLSPVPSDNADRVEIEVLGMPQGHLVNGYRVVLRTARADDVALDETVLLHDTVKHPDPYERNLGIHTESQLRLTAEDPDWQKAGIAKHVYPILAGCRVFHFDDTSADAPMKKRIDDADNITLAADARNIAALLSRLHVEYQDIYLRIVRTVRNVAPFFDDFVLKSESGFLRLRWRQKGLDRILAADALSDGTLRFICLSTLLLQPDRPATVVLDEPELGLHPLAIHQLAALLRISANDGRKVVLATQSVTLLSQFDLAEVVVVERATQGTVVSRPSREFLSAWLDKYSLGELWEKNLLGGGPRLDLDYPPTGMTG